MKNRFYSLYFGHYTVFCEISQLISCICFDFRDFFPINMQDLNHYFSIMNFDYIKKRAIFYIIGVILMVVAVIAAFTLQLNLGIDMTG